MFIKFQTFVWELNDLKPVISDDQIESSNRDAVIEEFVNGLIEDGMVLAGGMTSLIVENHLIDTLCYRPMSDKEKESIRSAKAASAGIILPE